MDSARPAANSFAAEGPQTMEIQSMDDTSRKKFTKAGMIWHFTKGSRLLFVLTVIFGGIQSFTDMLNPQIFRAAIDNAIGGKPSEFPAWVDRIVDSVGGFSYLGKHLWIMAVAVMVVSILRMAGLYAMTVTGGKASETLIKYTRDSLFTHIERLPYSWHMKNHTGDIIQRCTSDVENMRRFVGEQMTSLLRVVIYIVESLYFMFSMNVKLTLIALILVPFIMAYSLIFRTKMEDGFRRCDEMEGVVSASVQENLTGIRVVRAFGKEKNELDRFKEKNQIYTDMWTRQGVLMGRFFSVLDFLSSVQILSVVVFGAIFCVNGKLEPGEYVAFVSYNQMLAWPIRRLGRILSEMAKAGVSVERLTYIMNSETERDREGAGEADMSGDIVFDDVSFAYDGGPLILKNVSFKIKSGSTLGILGGTGSGKSTLMLLLDRMYELPEDKGTISIGGTDIRDIRADYLRSNISMVLQEPYLFSRTIAENIGISSDPSDMEAIRSASQAACLDESIVDFAKGYDTFVGERGVTLSGGQKQRAAIARALTKKAPIMVFDDSLSAVDTETDAKIQAAMQSRFGDSTVIMISHRITTLSKADWIVVLDDGRIVEQGSPEDLLALGGVYRRISDIQSGADTERRQTVDEE